MTSSEAYYLGLSSHFSTGSRCGTSLLAFRQMVAGLRSQVSLGTRETEARVLLWQTGASWEHREWHGFRVGCYNIPPVSDTTLQSAAILQTQSILVITGLTGKCREWWWSWGQFNVNSTGQVFSWQPTQIIKFRGPYKVEEMGSDWIFNWFKWLHFLLSMFSLEQRVWTS